MLEGHPLPSCEVGEADKLGKAKRESSQAFHEGVGLQANDQVLGNNKWARIRSEMGMEDKAGNSALGPTVTFW